MDHDGGVEQALLGAQRRADDDHRDQLLAGAADVLERLERGVEQRVLMEQVLARVGGQPELREHDQRGVLLVRLLGERDRALRVEGGVADPHARHGGGDAHEAVTVDRLEWKLLERRHVQEYCVVRGWAQPAH